MMNYHRTKPVKPIDIDMLKAVINMDLINVRGELIPMNSLMRKREIVYARYVTFFFLFECGWAYEKIGKQFDKSCDRGYFDHATVMHGIRKFKDLSANARFYPDFVEIKNIVYPLLVNCLVAVDEVEDVDIEAAISECNTLDDFMKVKAIVLKKNIRA